MKQARAKEKKKTTPSPDERRRTGRQGRPLRPSSLHTRGAHQIPNPCRASEVLSRLLADLRICFPAAANHSALVPEMVAPAPEKIVASGWEVDDRQGSLGRPLLSSPVRFCARASPLCCTRASRRVWPVLRTLVSCFVPLNSTEHGSCARFVLHPPTAAGESAVAAQ